MTRQIFIKRGLTLPLSGTPDITPDFSRIEDARKPQNVIVTAADYVGLKPSFVVAEGDSVRLGQRLFSDKKNHGVWFTAPGSGIVKEIRRGAKRAFIDLTIELDDNEKIADEARGSAHTFAECENLSRDEIVAGLMRSGWWNSLRARPFGKIASPNLSPYSLFVTAIDTHPLAANPNPLIAVRRDDFLAGIQVLSKLPQHKIYICGDENFPYSNSSRNNFPFLETKIANGEVVVFSGKHPTGLVGTHMHFLAPVGQKRQNWHLNYQDVIAIGRYFLSGEIDVSRVISLAGPQARTPRLLRTRIGASLDLLTAGEMKAAPNRVISGSVLGGRLATSDELPPSEWQTGLGRYHLQVSLVQEMPAAEFFGWLFPGINKFSASRLLVSYWISQIFPKRQLAINTAINGGRRAIFPVRTLDDVMPLDILPLFLFRALEIGDLDESEALGALELEEEDVALCTLVDPGKNDYAKSLRSMLNLIAREEEAPHH